MRFSVIIPVYNVAQYLRPCVDSVLANDCSDCEIILVDDGATDGVCPRLCDEIGVENPALIRVIHQENQGLGGARNTGLEAARGEYLLFLDSDDTIAPETLSVLSRAVERTHCDIYSFQAWSTDGQGGKSSLKISEVWPGPFFLDLHPEFLFSLPAACMRLWRRSLFTRSGIRFPSRVWYEDIRTCTKLFALAGSIETLPDPLYLYLARPGSIMRSGDLARNREILLAFDDILDWFCRQNLLETYRDALCRLAVDHILLAASVRVARADPYSPIAGELAGYMEEHFPGYARCPYLKTLSPLHKLLVFLIRRKRLKAVQWLFRLKDGA